MGKWYLFRVFTFCKSLCVINVGSPYASHGVPIYILYLYDQMWLVGTTLIWSVAFIANARLELVCLGTLIRRLNVSLLLTVSFLIEFWNEWRQSAHHKWGNNTTWTVHFCLNRCKWELPDQHIANCIFPLELFFNILIISTVCSPQLTTFIK